MAIFLGVEHIAHGHNGRFVLLICHAPTSRSLTKPVMRCCSSISKISTLDFSVTTLTAG